MADISAGPNSKSGPPRVRNPTVLFGLPFLHQRVSKCSREWDIDCSVGVQMSDLCFPESEFLAPETVRVNRNVGPGSNLIRQSLKIVHITVTLPHWMTRSQDWNQGDLKLIFQPSIVDSAEARRKPAS